MTRWGGRRRGLDAAMLQRHFGTSDGLLPLWIAEPTLELAPAIVDAMRARADVGWYGYETRPDSVVDAFWDWMGARHGWDRCDLHTLVSPTVGTSIAVLIERFTAPGEGVLIQPPVFTGFKPLITAAGRIPVRSPLLRTETGYRIDLADLEEKAADPANRLLLLCTPHNPVGRVWEEGELAEVAAICAEHEVFVVADEIHADVVLGSHSFTPFATAAAGTEVRWAATHGPVKTFGLAGVSDTLLVTDSAEVAERFETRSSQLHLTRNNVFGLAAFEVAYREGGPWLDRMLDLVGTNMAVLRDELPDGIHLVEPEATYLAWLDLRSLGLDVPELASWLAGPARLALSPGHWFGREGAGFARMTVAVPTELVRRAVDQLSRALPGG